MSIISILNKRQICLLKNISKTYQELIKPTIWNKKYDPLILNRVEKNINYISEELKNKSCNEYTFTPLFPFIEIETQENTEIEREPHLTQQGLNELYFREKIYCKNDYTNIKEIKDIVKMITQI